MATTDLSIAQKPAALERVHGPRLAGIWQKAGIAAWAVVWVVCLAAFGLSIYFWFRWDSTPAAGLFQFFPKIQSDGVAAMSKYQQAILQSGLSLPLYGGLFAGLRLLSGAPYFLLSILIMRRRSDRLMAVLFAIVLVVTGAAGRWISANWVILPETVPWFGLLMVVLNFTLDCSVILLYAFPDGRFVPRWTRWLAGGVLLISFTRNFLTDSPLNLDNLPGIWGSLPTRILLLAGIFALVYRYRKSADAVQMQQIKWIAAGTLLLGAFYFAHYLIYQTPLLDGLDWTPRLQFTYEMALEPGWYVAQFILAICIGLSVLRYRLWDIDLVINRVLVYGSLTLLTMGLYLAAVAGLSRLVSGLSGTLAFFLAAGVTAILFEPLRLRLQRLINRLMYGERDDPYAVLTRLSNTLEQSPIPGQLLPSLAVTIGQALKIPYAAIWLLENGQERLAAAYGKSQPNFVALPLTYQSETIGSLHAAPRARGEEFSPTDLRLLENIARQAGAAAQAVRLNSELVRSRAEIVTAREEERRRLRRDLHDGLGPILAGQTLKMAAVRQLVRQNPERAESLVDDVIHQNETTIAEVRRLVYGLRPPALDELGLVEAVRDLVRRGGQEEMASSGMHIEVSGPPSGLPKLPAAVEVNAYRIVMEALTNVARHAKAGKCLICFDCEPVDGNGQTVLRVQVMDDGAGIPDSYRAGVGIRSMRERAEEIGGRLELQSIEPHGTRIDAWLPLIETK